MQTVAIPAVTRQILKRHGLRLKKGLGQHFLVEPRIVREIVDGAELGPGDVVVEVGPGIGTLTQALARHAGLVIALELDRALLPVLAETVGEYPNVRVIQGDAMRVDLDELVAGQMPGLADLPRYKVVANLPYYITTPLLMRFWESGYRIHSLVLMVQQEVAERILAAPGGKAYGALSVAAQYRTTPFLVTRVPPGVFIPPPEVASMVVRLVMRTEPAVAVPDEQLYFALVKAAFGQRRKTLLNALSNGGFGPTKDEWEEMLGDAHIDGRRRGETLSLQEFAAVCGVLWHWKVAQKSAGILYTKETAEKD